MHVRSLWVGLVGVALVGLAGLFAFGCDEPPASDSLKEWTPADHHSSDDGKLAQGRQPAGGGRDGGEAMRATDVGQLVELAWRQQCTPCHGPGGRGDGQMGPMVQAPDLSRPDLQANASDAEMASVIKNGRNRMPKFDLPEPVLRGLVARVRSFRER